MSEAMQMSRLSGVEMASILLLCLGEEAAATVFEELDDADIRKISRCMMGMEHIPVDVARQVIKKFEKAQEENAGIYVKGEAFVQKAIAGSANPKRREMLMDQLSAGVSFRPLETIALMLPRMVAGLLEHEHPQTVALILSTQTPEHTSKIVDFLDEEKRADIMYRIAKIDKVSPEVLQQIEDSLRQEIGMVVSRDHQQVGGVDKVVDILGRLGKGKDRAILSQIEINDPALAEAIRRRMFTFEELIVIDNRGIQMILREINNDTLVKALKSASEEIKEKIFSNISSRAAETIKDDLAALGPIRLSDVEAAQQEIIQAAMQLAEDGKVAIPGRGTSDVMV